MNFFTRAATTALTGLAIFGFASAAFAHHVEQQPFVASESRLLLDAVRRTGHQILVNDKTCEEKAGLFGAATNRKQLLICVDNHKGDADELADTIRHEALHLVQMCKGRSGGATIALLAPEDREQFLNDAVTWLHMPVSSYPSSQHHVEAEARVLAHHLDEHQVAQLLVKFCGGTTGWR